MVKQLDKLNWKVRPVPFAQIEYPTAGVVQREFRPAWAAYLAANFDPNKMGLPVVNHVVVGGKSKFRAIDGMHRFKAALLWDPSLESSNVDCMVVEDLPESVEAELFLALNDSKPVAPLDKHFVACTAGRKRDLDIRRAVESNGQKIARNRNDGISAIGALGSVHDKCGAAVLEQVIRTSNLAFPGDPLGFDRSIIEGLGLVYNRFNGRTSEKAMGQRLGALKQGARELLRRAEDMRVRTGNQKKHCVAAVIVDIYNRGEGHGHGKGRLPGWWKDTTVKEIA